MSADSVATCNWMSGVAAMRRPEASVNACMKQPPWLMPTASGPLRASSHCRPILVRPIQELSSSLVVIGFVLVPCVMFAYAVRHRRPGLLRLAAAGALVGLLLNRLNISIVAFNWQLAERYFPSWQEFIVTLTVLFTEIWVFRWIVLRLPILRDAHELPNPRPLES